MRRTIKSLVGLLVAAMMVAVTAGHALADEGAQASLEWEESAGFHLAAHPQATASLRIVSDDRMTLEAMLAVMSRLTAEAQARLALRLQAEAQVAAGSGAVRAGGTVQVDADTALVLLARIDVPVRQQVEAEMGVQERAGTSGRVDAGARSTATGAARGHAAADGTASGQAAAEADLGTEGRAGDSGTSVTVSVQGEADAKVDVP
ncbi:hypothetical protein [Limnochorda pilosa]|uniref:Uncharacterized protein n=1 Tax=Limnochorda pilosa TaxID=1555112 RepID=A0A0K2SIR0_LIMPI|nr:hypothetical protein [Limnochorda pilosa]BAS26912.1 hypothetical protein LIP_1055 [Limnochorda pilosa]